MDRTPFRRRNGRSPACEPCRSRKVACDHTRPVCRRCTKRKQESSCVYVVPSEVPPSTPAAPTPRRSARASSQPGSPILSPPLSATPAPPRQGYETPTSADTGYLGYTSYCSVYEETEIVLMSSALGAAATGPDTECTAATPSSAAFKLSPRTLDTCLKILERVPEPAVGFEYFQPKEMCFDSFPHVIALRILRSFYTTFGRYLGRKRNPEHVEHVARRLSSNTARPFSETEPDAERWIAQLLGDNLRWESVGVFVSFCGEKKASRETLRRLVEVCTELSPANSLHVYLSLKYANAESCVSGDASLLTWKGHSDTVAYLTFLGLHAETNPPNYEPTLASEFRRSLNAWVYGLDMSLVSFTGRPPLLSSAYSSTPPPLDLSTGELLSSKESMAEAVRGLDEDGWGTKGEINPPTARRARQRVAMIRERILRVALGHEIPPSLDMLLDLRERALETYSRLPAVIRYYATGINGANTDVEMPHPRLILRLEHLQNILLIERLLLRHGKQDRSDILATSFELVSNTLVFWTHREKIPLLRDDHDWVAMSYAAPAGGILCLELLQPTLNPGHQASPEITRSTIIQKLSLLVGFLDWNEPTAPNNQLCANCSVIIRRVLDYSLNTVAAPRNEMPNTFEWDLGAQLDFNFDLLDTFDWLRPEAG